MAPCGTGTARTGSVGTATTTTATTTAATSFATVGRGRGQPVPCTPLSLLLRKGSSCAWRASGWCQVHPRAGLHLWVVAQGDAVLPRATTSPHKRVQVSAKPPSVRPAKLLQKRECRETSANARERRH